MHVSGKKMAHYVIYQNCVKENIGSIWPSAALLLGTKQNACVRGIVLYHTLVHVLCSIMYSIVNAMTGACPAQYTVQYHDNRLLDFFPLNPAHSSMSHPLQCPINGLIRCSSRQICITVQRRQYSSPVRSPGPPAGSVPSIFLLT